MNQNGGTRTDTMVKLILVFFLSISSFSIGTYVGMKIKEANVAAEAALKAKLEQEQKKDDIAEEIKAITKLLEEVDHANHGR
jgi:hypothetical protein